MLKEGLYQKGKHSLLLKELSIKGNGVCYHNRVSGYGLDEGV